MHWHKDYPTNPPWDMVAKEQRSLVLALRGDQFCCLFMVGTQLEDWRSSRKGARSPQQAKAVLRAWFATYRPERIVLQHPRSMARKSSKKRAIVAALKRSAVSLGAKTTEVIRRQAHANIYEEAATLVQFYPQLKFLQPVKPPIWKVEPRNAIYFEALALALQANRLLHDRRE